MTTVMEPTTAARLTVALGKIDRLLRVETNRSKHMVLVQIRTEVADGIAHLGSLQPGSMCPPLAPRARHKESHGFRHRTA